MKLALCIPTYLAERELQCSLPVLSEILPSFERALIIDSSSTDKSVAMAKAAGFEVYVIPASEFDHGRTRQLAVELVSDCDIVFFLTQDAVLTGPESIRKVVAAFNDPKVAIAFGRQLPRIGAGPIEAHARLFSYPPESMIKTQESIPQLGLRTAVVSNSFAAYRRSTLLELGGFPSGTLFGEDTLTGAKAILAGYKIAYVGEATVYHSHGYTLAQEFRRYFDNGVFYSRETWILRTFGKAESSGKAYVLSEFRHILKTNPLLLPRSFVSVVVKLLGYKIGSLERFLPGSWKIHLSMNKAFWRREMEPSKG